MLDDSSVDSYLPQLQDMENKLQHVEQNIKDNHLNNDTKDTIICNFISASFPLHNKDRAIDDTLA